ncbi:DNA-binding NarL/FixJ family response regulator [Rhodopirellula rubra]|uniref:DNA-binding NarL/FixJ family response regulator n=1 Tax=Aporhodopirellula rubra TaxID=980271 RepID=A0A7W5E1H3_9BACT|nr:response regulator transcription factor [Aporhodopirellula rubra]MBB3208077.1 DNA-binding NarL/FixJ family response regulator [Aporhodopirellula rubra]
MINVMLVEDNPEYREVVRIALEDHPNIFLASQFGTAEIAIRTLVSADARSRPDVILLDLRLPGMDGLAALKKILTNIPESKVIILTQSDKPQDVVRAITLGAAGYLLKTVTLDEITEGILAVMRGDATIDKSVAKYLLDALRSNRQTADNEILTQRELEVLGLLAQGLVKKEIANQLGIRYATVDTHIAHIYEKLGVSNAPGAVHQAHQLGLLNQQG